MRRPSLALAAVALGWGTIPLVAAKVALAAPALVFGRVGLAALALAAVVRRVPGPPLLSVQRGRALAAGAALAVHWSAQFAAYRRAPDATVIFVIYLAPVGVAALAPRLLGAALRRVQVAALAAGVAGLVLVVGPGLRRTAPAGLAFAGLASASFVAVLLLAEPLVAAYGGIRATLLQLGVASVLLVPLALPALRHPGAFLSPWLALLAIGHTAVGTSVELAVLRRVGATTTAILGYLEPVGVVVVGALVLHEVPGPPTIIGGMLILAAGAVLALREPAGSAPPCPPPAAVPAGSGPGCPVPAPAAAPPSPEVPARAAAR